jgi:hypothetical protein
MAHLRDLATEHPYPAPATVRLGDIWRDPDIASIPIRADHVEKLRAEFMPHLVGVPIVSRRDDGQVVVLNGSHRCEALRAMFGEDLELDVTLYDGLTRDQEVAIFERHHKKYLADEIRAKDASTSDDESHVWTFDIDSTITAAPKQYARLASGLKAMNDQIVCVTGHGPQDTRKELLDALGFPYDSIVIVDPEEDGAGKAKVLEHLGSWFHFDDHVEFGPEIIKVCPVAFQFVEPPGDIKPKKAAKAAQDDLQNKRSMRLAVSRGAQSGSLRRSRRRHRLGLAVQLDRYREAHHPRLTSEEVMPK